MKLIPFKYLKEEEQFIYVWIPAGYDVACIKRKDGKFNAVAAYNNVGYIISSNDLVLVDDNYDVSQYHLDEINDLLKRLSKTFRSAYEYNKYLRCMNK